tara:strand:+ start:1409 stop:2662 length:1254 start_codon:yes stop_codon:yes gene_type:complete
MQQAINSFSWETLQGFSSPEINRIEGPNNPYASLRLFGESEENVRVTLYRDHHAWCPYCQKVWLWLEWKQIPYRIKKVTMRCYGKKENWYLNKVPSGMLPAIEIDKNIITESDDILLYLEKVFGTLGRSLLHPEILKLRNLERQLFRAWCIWLCNPSLHENQEKRKKEQFQQLAEEMNVLLKNTNGAWLDPNLNNSNISLPGSGDIIFIPYLERMNASLTYYKGLCLRKEYKYIDNWFKTLESFDVYKGTQGDFHTHSHDLPPQMGACWINSNPQREELSQLIDTGKGLGELEFSCSNPPTTSPEAIALQRVIKHRDVIKKVNPIGETTFDQPLRAALTKMITKQDCMPNKGSAIGLRYLRDRISVPRDMPLLSARKLRQALEITAQLDSSKQGPKIPTRNRLDQNPEPFLKLKRCH